MNDKKILVIIPAYNESGNINKTVKEVLSLDFSVTPFVVDDGSSDTTAHEAKEAGALVVSIPFNVGIGGAVQTGFKYAQKENYDIAVQVDGDGQHDVSYLSKLIEPVINDSADIVVGSRFLPPFTGYRSSFIRRIGINFFSYLISFLTGLKVTDPTSGFRAYNKKMIDIFVEHYPIDFPEPEAIMIVKKCNGRFTEIPVKMRERQAGHSSIRYLWTLYYMIKVTFTILLDTLKSYK